MKVIIFLLSSFFLFISCKKNELKALPEPTQVGARTFGCLIDGTAWVANGSGGFNGDKPVEGGYQDNYNDPKQIHNFWITASNRDGTTMDIYVRNVYKIGEYPLSFDTYTRPTVLFPENYIIFNSKDGSYITTSQYTGKIIITKADTAISLISGTFEFTAFNRVSKKTIIVTNGRFDTRL